MIQIENLAPAPAPHQPAAINVVDRIDAVDRWAALASDRQAAIGIAALDLLASWSCQDHATETSPMLQTALGRAGDQAEHQAVAALLAAFDAAVPAEIAYSREGQPLLPASLGPVCQRCGCSQEDACAAGCDWATSTLCMACSTGPESADRCVQQVTIFDRSAGEIAIEVEYQATGPDHEPEITILQARTVEGAAYDLSGVDCARLTREIAQSHRIIPDHPGSV